MVRHLSHIDASSPDDGTYAIMTDGAEYELLSLDPDAGITDTMARLLGACPLAELVAVQEIPATYLNAYALGL